MQFLINNIKLKTKFSLLVIIPIIGFFLLLIRTLMVTGSIEEQTQTITKENATTISEINNLIIQAFHSGQATRNILLNPEDDLAKKNFETSKIDYNKSLTHIYEIHKNNPAFLTEIDEIKDLGTSLFEKHEYIVRVCS